ncbi:MAG: dTDP-4-dehydrorhamnose reductase [Pseudomonadota bacterium]|nr:dTDP-4-dehydrorhamnose reductase [Pseudomonadota bacterium]
MINTHRILVTGGNGRLGQALARKGCLALGRDRLDINDPTQLAAVIEQNAPAFIINAAAFTNVDAAEAQPELAKRVNADGAGTVARLAAVAGIPLIHVSTDLVFSEGDANQPLKESTWTAPASVYGETKLEGETLVRSAGGRHVVVRVSWLFGEGSESFIAKILKFGAQRETLQLVTDEYGRPTSFDALAEQLVHLAGMMASGHDLPTVLHLGPPGPVNRLEWAERIFAVAREHGGPDPKLEPVLGSHFPTPARRARGVVLDTSLADGLIGPMPDWRPACDESVRTLLKG